MTPQEIAVEFFLERKGKLDKLQEEVDDLQKALDYVKAKEKYSFQKATKWNDPISDDWIKAVEDSILLKTIRQKYNTKKQEYLDYHNLIANRLTSALPPNDEYKKTNDEQITNLIKKTKEAYKNDLGCRKNICRKLFERIGFSDYDDEVLATASDDDNNNKTGGGDDDGTGTTNSDNNNNNNINNGDDDDDDDDPESLRFRFRLRRWQVLKRRWENDCADLFYEHLNFPFIRLTQADKENYCRKIYDEMVVQVPDSSSSSSSSS